MHVAQILLLCIITVFILLMVDFLRESIFSVF